MAKQYYCCYVIAEKCLCLQYYLPRMITIVLIKHRTQWFLVKPYVMIKHVCISHTIILIPNTILHPNIIILV